MRLNPRRVLFAAAAGPRIGFGHVIRARSLARALGVVPTVVLRGTRRTRRRARAMGIRCADARGGDVLRRLAPDVLVVDDPSEVAVRRWVRRARRAGVPVATVHDLGIAAWPSDLLIDGSVAPRRTVRGTFATLHGPAFAILDPAIHARRGRTIRPVAGRVLLALGGGRTATVTAALARAIAARADRVEVYATQGFVGRRRPPEVGNVRWIEARDGLASELTSASVVVAAGGVTLYEACALGVPAVAVALTKEQHVTIRALARRGAVIDAGALYGAAAPAMSPASFASTSGRRVAAQVVRLLADATARRRLALAGRRLVDGRGAFRVAARVRRLASAAATRVVDVA